MELEFAEYMLMVVVRSVFFFFLIDFVCVYHLAVVIESVVCGWRFLVIFFAFLNCLLSTEVCVFSACCLRITSVSFGYVFLLTFFISSATCFLL